MFETIIFVLLVSSVSILGSFYVRRYQKPDALIGIYVGSVLMSNILAYKIASYDLGVFTFFAPASVIMFSVTYLLTDIVNERFGRETTVQMIWVAFLAQLAAVVFILTATALPSAPFWSDQEAYYRILSSAPRIIAASLFTFVIMETLDAYIFHWFKQKTNGKHLWLRNVASTLPAMTLDTILFVFLAFYGVFPVLPLITGVIAIKWLVGVVDIPFMYLNRRLMRD
jgi:uncharacterized integral membrane protein (TIGR00697 family)